MADRPDIVLIMTDQQRFDQVGDASAGHFETPNLDALAVLLQHELARPIVELRATTVEPDA